jgi:ribosomal protein S18 acetylase RimI-like enzyme
VIRPLTPTDEPAAERLLDEALGGRAQVRKGEVIDVLARPALGAFVGDDLAGLATYSVDRVVGAELVALAVGSAYRRRGLGAALVDAAFEAAVASGGRRMWLITTNDNLDALALYQRRGFRLVAVNAGAVDRARLLKPSIPDVGAHGIPMHDELMLERVVKRR